MRVVNMAHGAFFLLGGYIALKVQRNMVGERRRVRALERPGEPDELDAARRSRPPWSSAASGSSMQQLFLRWNQGQELRQALITIAISIILADQMLAHFGGVAAGHRLARRRSTSSSTSASTGSSTR